MHSPQTLPDAVNDELRLVLKIHTNSVSDVHALGVGAATNSFFFIDVEVGVRVVVDVDVSAGEEGALRRYSTNTRPHPLPLPALSPRRRPPTTTPITPGSSTADTNGVASDPFLADKGQEEIHLIVCKANKLHDKARHQIFTHQALSLFASYPPFMIQHRPLADATFRLSSIIDSYELLLALHPALIASHPVLVASRPLLIVQSSSHLRRSISLLYQWPSELKILPHYPVPFAE
ncbi:hypothetical protein R3P38DRAFT_3181865 [Favolaschia claudopus]|uniref:UDENN domain-containing protein n=1 Tax=Favolaschia claudopus TaxID=2862362 RepID=A0AAW0CPX6_9AGAR